MKRTNVIKLSALVMSACLITAVNAAQVGGTETSTSISLGYTNDTPAMKLGFVPNPQHTGANRNLADGYILGTVSVHFPGISSGQQKVCFRGSDAANGLMNIRNSTSGSVDVITATLKTSAGEMHLASGYDESGSACRMVNQSDSLGLVYKGGDMTVNAGTYETTLYAAVFQN
ncbi:hypothetical protein BUL74_01810 [Salmonella enterica subsp. enterica serovar 4,[5],12:i:-]|nr:hypothetical protein [Salmonella enterica]EBV1873355.1 hypothetical protein [Salmonella enterica subsp. enterica serovar Adelaide]ECC9078411.1 hypothetical protein [Salmonella enterica subsp. enterica]ECU8272969.1 hypothetical protein [Salmonella enterica subsp. enterica serovar 4,[5],12:i:-]EDD5564762.1 hypothetical protein [Salmonella enterica subsp. enterica serovar Bareilly]EDD5596302.1 hypothetical protein [Salmonella enterica subsp. enterica serovar Montevideo]EDM6258261.1 hypothetic